MNPLKAAGELWRKSRERLPDRVEAESATPGGSEPSGLSTEGIALAGTAVLTRANIEIQ